MGTSQINIRIDDALASGLDRVAAKHGQDRLTVIREGLREMVSADAEGRPMFARSSAPGPERLAELVQRVESLATELERISRQNAKREAEVRKAGNAAEVEATMARERIVRETAALLAEAAAPLRKELGAMRAELVDAVAKDPRLDEIAARIDRVERLAAEPRVEHNLVLGADRKLTFKFLGRVWAITLAFGALLLIVFGMLVPPVGVRVSNLMLGGGDQAVCALVNYRHATDNCRLRVNGEKVGVALDAGTDRPERRK